MAIVDDAVKFNSEIEFVTYRKTKTCRELGTDSEGTCYLGKDGLTYKNLFTSYAEYLKEKKLDTSMDVKSFLDVVERKFTNHPPRKGNPYIKQ